MRQFLHLLVSITNLFTPSNNKHNAKLHTRPFTLENLSLPDKKPRAPIFGPLKRTNQNQAHHVYGTGNCTLARTAHSPFPQLILTKMFQHIYSFLQHENFPFRDPGQLHYVFVMTIPIPNSQSTSTSTSADLIPILITPP